MVSKKKNKDQKSPKKTETEDLNFVNFVDISVKVEENAEDSPKKAKNDEEMVTKKDTEADEESSSDETNLETLKNCNQQQKEINKLYQELMKEKKRHHELLELNKILTENAKIIESKYGFPVGSV